MPAAAGWQWTSGQLSPRRRQVLPRKGGRQRPSLSRFHFAAIAQWAERRIVDPEDIGSSPVRSASFSSIPLDDIGDATLELEDRAILFMRYIRRAMNDGAFLPLASWLLWTGSSARWRARG